MLISINQMSESALKEKGWPCVANVTGHALVIPVPAGIQFVHGISLLISFAEGVCEYKMVKEVCSNGFYMFRREEKFEA